MKLKLCGMRRPEDIQAANRCRPDYVGFVFAPSRRRVTPREARELRKLLDPAVQAVGVFVNCPLRELAEIAQTVGLDVIQLHGDEDRAYLAGLRELLQSPVWKAVRVKSQEEIWEADGLGADALLLDAFTEGSYGGTGARTDWELITRTEVRTPFLLAGGLNASNLAQAVETVRPWGVDLSGGIETDGWKDPAKMEQVARLIRKLEGES